MGMKGSVGDNLGGPGGGRGAEETLATFAWSGRLPRGPPIATQLGSLVPVAFVTELP